MSIVPSGTDSTTTLKELPPLITRWLKVQEEIATLNSEIKQRRTTAKALKEVILRIMETSGYNNLKVNRVLLFTRRTKLLKRYLMIICYVTVRSFLMATRRKQKHLLPTWNRIDPKRLNTICGYRPPRPKRRLFPTPPKKILNTTYTQ